MQIHEFQEMMRQLYFERDLARGINGTFNWLVDEVEELGEELQKGTNERLQKKSLQMSLRGLLLLPTLWELILEKAAD